MLIIEPFLKEMLSLVRNPTPVNDVLFLHYDDQDNCLDLKLINDKQYHYKITEFCTQKKMAYIQRYITQWELNKDVNNK